MEMQRKLSASRHCCGETLLRGAGGFLDASQETFQQELFPAEMIQRAGGVLRIVVQDPNRKDRTRTIIIASVLMRELLAILEEVAPKDETVLIHGESGTGKNWFARLLHAWSDRRDGPLVEFSANHYPEGLLDSGLFGHEKGAFSGAFEARPGKLELAEGGTFFLNEVGDLPLPAQAKLLQFFDDRVFERVGGTRVHVANIRVIAATHRDLPALVKEGKFREDLFHRLNVVPLEVPPLRERPEEIPAIAELFLRELSTLNSKPWLRWAPDTLEFLARQPWRGNVRALRNAITSMVLLAKGEFLRVEDIPDVVLVEAAGGIAAPPARLSEVEERRRYVQAYHTYQGNRCAMARFLGTSASQVLRKIRLYRLDGREIDQG
jgi:DNA-binding NtrC family response regulator